MSLKAEPHGGDGAPPRVTQLLGMPVQGPDGTRLGRVVDLRVARDPAVPDVPVYVVQGLLVGRGRTGGLLGYDRRQEQGPVALGALMRWLHRDTRLVEWQEVAVVDWDSGVVRVTTDAYHTPFTDQVP